MSEQQLLESLEPPSGGWERLVARRDVPADGWKIGIPLALAASLATLMLLVRPDAAELDVPWIGGRLVGNSSTGAGLQRVSTGTTTALPSEDARVRLYWVGDSAAD